MNKNLKRLISTAVSDCRTWGRGYGIDDESENEYEVDAYWVRDDRDADYSILNVEIRIDNRKFAHLLLDRVSNAYQEARCFG